MSTARAVPTTRGDLEGDDALRTLRRCGRWRVARDSLERFRAADGFSHSRALAFQFTLTLLPALIAVVGLAAALEQETFRRVVAESLSDLAPGAVGGLLTDALKQGVSAAGSERGETALTLGGAAALAAGATAMAQIERGANRIYGVEIDRPFLRKYAVGLALASTAGLLALLGAVILVGGTAIRDAAGWGDGFNSAWGLLRWPLGLVCAVGSIALLFQRAPRREQPEPSWLAYGAAASTLLWVAFLAILALFVEVSNSFGSTYGPLAGTIGVLLWAFLSSLALFLGLAFAAQLEAVRAGEPGPRVDHEENVEEAPSFRDRRAEKRRGPRRRGPRAASDGWVYGVVPSSPVSSTGGGGGGVIRLPSVSTT